MHISRYSIAGLTAVIVSVVASLAGCSTSSGAGGASSSAASSSGNGAPNCAGKHIDRSAPAVSSHDVRVDAPISLVWSIHTDVDKWSTWRQDVSKAQRLDAGALHVGSKLSYTSGPLAVTATVRAVHPDECTLWVGPGGGITGTHLWTFHTVAGMTVVHTEESWSGAPVDADPARAKTMLTAALTNACNNLKKVAEARAG